MSFSIEISRDCGKEIIMNRFGWISTLGGLVFGLLLWTAPPVWAAATCNANIRATTPTEDFTLDDSNGTATHLKTGLMWMRCILGQNWDSASKTCTGSQATPYTWGAALRAARGASFAGQSDWRLPNAKELATLVEERCYGPSLNETVFPGVSPYLYVVVHPPGCGRGARGSPARRSAMARSR